MAALELTGPAYPAALAEIVVDPAPTAVASPEELIVATELLLEFHVTEPVITWVEAWLAFPKVPVAVNCAVCPTVRAWLVGDTLTESNP
jgi:hypothetical protein